MRSVRGVMTIVQEDRFRLVTEDGRGLLLTLSRRANVGYGELERLVRERTPVRVAYEGEPDHGGVAVRLARD